MRNKEAPAGAPVAELSAKDALAIAVAEARAMAARLQDMNVSDAMSAAHEALALAYRDHDPARGPLRAFIIQRVRAQVREAWRRPLRRGRHGAGATRREVPSDRVHGLDSTEEVDISVSHRVVERALHEAALEVEAAAERRRLIEDMRRLVGDEVLAALLSDASERDLAAAAGVSRRSMVESLQRARERLAEVFSEKVQMRGPRGGRRAL